MLSSSSSSASSSVWMLNRFTTSRVLAANVVVPVIGTRSSVVDAAGRVGSSVFPEMVSYFKMSGCAFGPVRRISKVKVSPSVDSRSLSMATSPGFAAWAGVATQTTGTSPMAAAATTERAARRRRGARSRDGLGPPGAAWDG